MNFAPRPLRKHVALTKYVPGALLCSGVSAVATGVQRVQEALLGRPFLEAVVLAILIGTCLRTFLRPGASFVPGIFFCGKTLLEVAVALLGASISVQAMAGVGSNLLIGIAVVVALAILVSYLLARLFGLPYRMAMLIACGNAICGNSAIAAVSPIVGATSEEVASSVAFTAVLGIGVVLTLPLLIPLFALSHAQYGVLAGMTVYAVPQVLAATFPVGVLSTQVGTLVKLVRVLMLGPVVLLISVFVRRSNHLVGGPTADQSVIQKPHSSLSLLPWFIIAFLVLAAGRSLGLIPERVLLPTIWASGTLTIVSMAALGLSVDLKVLGRVGGKITMAVTASLVVLTIMSLILIKVTSDAPARQLENAAGFQCWGIRCS